MKLKKMETKIAPPKNNWRGHGKTLAKEIVMVAINATKGVTGHAFEWALKNVVQPGDSIILLALLPPPSSGWKFWQASHSISPAKERKRLQEAKTSCKVMLEQFQSLCDAKKVHTIVKIIPGSVKGTATIEAKKLSVTWMLLDKNLKNEERVCTEELQCNLVVVKRQNAKILRLNLKQSPMIAPSKQINLFDSQVFEAAAEREGTPSSSPDLGTPFTLTDRGNSPASSSTSPFSSAEPGSCTNSAHGNACWGEESGYVVSESDTDDQNSNSRRSKVTVRSRKHAKESRKNPDPPCAKQQQLLPFSRPSLSMREGGSKIWTKSSLPTDASSPRMVLSDFLTSLRRADLDPAVPERRSAQVSLEGSVPSQDHSSVRTAVSLSKHAPLGPPPLCSICQHKAPAFGRPPRAFTFKELELATGGFSQANFLAEGGFGSVHRGILPEGQVVAVKQHKLASSQGDVEFCSEVEVLSCAQHRNVVMLIGYCIEESRRLLVYEFICNGSLDAHLYGKGKFPLEWQHRRKIAVGAARGLRYLHEECRVGCIVHRDLRPNNILLTHDYEPMVGDFGLARWQPDGELGVETRVIGTFGYLAPEYTQSGQITEKADVYSFGVVLLELVTGRKAIDITRPKGQQCLAEWVRTHLRKKAPYEELVDPKLQGCYDGHELSFMLQAASLCISRNPDLRPRMSQVLRMLEGDSDDNSSGRRSFDGYKKMMAPAVAEKRRSSSAVGGRSSNRLCSKSSTGADATKWGSSGNLSLEELKIAYRDKLHSRRLSYGDLRLY